MLARATPRVSANWDCVMFSAAKNCSSLAFIFGISLLTNVTIEFQSSKSILQADGEVVSICVKTLPCSSLELNNAKTLV